MYCLGSNYYSSKEIDHYSKKVLRIINFNYFIQAHFSLYITSSNLVVKLHQKKLFLSLDLSTSKYPLYFMIGLHRYETYWFVTNHLNIPTFQTKKYGRFSIRASARRSWNYIQNMLQINFSLKNSTPKSKKYFLTKYFIESD